MTAAGVPDLVKGLAAYPTLGGLLITWAPPDANGPLTAYYLSVCHFISHPSAPINQRDDGLVTVL